MTIFCIPKNLVEKLKDSALKGEVDIKKLYDMTSKERREFFTKYTNSELGSFINAKFETAMISKQKEALTDWAKSVFTPKGQSKPVYKNIIDKINSLNELGVLSTASEKAFLTDLISDKLGVNVSAKEVGEIKQRAEVIESAQKVLGDDLGNPAKENETIAFFKAKKEMDNYLRGLNPANRVKVLTGTIGRGAMLFSVKSPLLNIVSNMEVGFTEALSRRIADRTLKSTDNKIATDYMKMVNKVYQASGYDISRMTVLNDTGASGGRVLGDVIHSQGKGGIRKVGRFMEDVVFKQLMGAPDVAFSAAHFADSVNLGALKLAKGDKVLAKEIMVDAMRLDPRTPMGETLRQQGILDAQKATWTDHTWASNVSESFRKILNGVSGDLRVGDYLLPFVKTPANIIATGMDYAGMGIPKALFDTVAAIRKGEFGSREHIQKVSRELVRSGLGITAAAIIAAQLDDDDFVGAYDSGRAQIEALRNSNTNSFRVGNKWISVDWLGPLAVPFTAIMYARKYGKTPGEKTFQYSKAVLAQSLNIPGVAGIYDWVKNDIFKSNQTLEEMTGETKNYLMEQVATRLIPSFISDIAKATDPYNRTTSKGAQTVLAKIPGLRRTLPVKTNIFGEPSESESAIASILFGSSRFRTNRETELIKEINTVSNATDKNINFTDWAKSSGKTLAQFKEKVGEVKYKEASIKYGKQLKARLEKMMKSPTYKNLSDENKLKEITGLDALVQDKVLASYGFRYKTVKNKKLPRF